MVSIFLQNLALIGASLGLFAYHKADYTLYIAIAAILLTSGRLLFIKQGGSAKITLFLIQAFILALIMWYILFPRQFHDLFGTF